MYKSRGLRLKFQDYGAKFLAPCMLNRYAEVNKKHV